MSLQILQGDCREVLQGIPSDSIDCCVTSPPYWGLRDYGVDGQMGQEETPEAFVADMVAVFREVRRVLKSAGTCWVNIGDSYATSGGAGRQGVSVQRANRTHTEEGTSAKGVPTGMKAKDLVGIPWMLAFALRADGWYLRQEIIWHKPNPMPESITDRCTKAHESIFLLAKSSTYFFDSDAIKEKASAGTHARLPGNVNPPKGQAAYESGAAEHRTKAGLLAYAERKRMKSPAGWDRSKGEGGHGAFHKDGRARKEDPGPNNRNNASFDAAMAVMPDTRNKRSVWTVPSAPFKEAHFATYPPDLIKPCILAGCPVGGVVLDPFGGSGTTGAVALDLGRRAILIELNPEYIAIMRRRTSVTVGLGL